ncbi:uncharacterized protein VTP21DRAFT_2682 [Calcarisporiella thermophila]|uniref:uncharacterized protein n=1 Tax=Calcarisporiella thermophila TaxID=911321 RepID=UPI0037420EFD
MNQYPPHTQGDYNTTTNFYQNEHHFGSSSGPPLNSPDTRSENDQLQRDPSSYYAGEGSRSNEIFPSEKRHSKANLLQDYHYNHMGAMEQYSPDYNQPYYSQGDQSFSNVQNRESHLPGNTYGAPTPKMEPLIVVEPPVSITKRKWIPYFTYLVTLLQLAALITEFVVYNKQTGQVIQTPRLNFMIGPSAETLVFVGSRFVPCMRPFADQSLQAMPCPSTVDPTVPGAPVCTLEQACGFGGFKSGQPDQNFRFITPLFLHGGIIHFLFNMFAQLSIGAQLERDIGPFRYALIYVISGVGGFIFGGNFSPVRSSSVGASGALFGVFGCLIIDIFLNWRQTYRPGWELAKMIIFLAISFVLGLLPFLDNFSHIGGFVFGLLAGAAFMPASHFGKRARAIILWITRVIALVLLVLLFTGLILNFYRNNPMEACPWCKYLACLPIDNWCDKYN